MSLLKDGDKGSNEDFSKNNEYCKFCFEEGEFIDKGSTLRERIEHNVELAIKIDTPECEAREMAESILPGLKRWKKNEETSTYDILSDEI